MQRKKDAFGLVFEGVGRHGGGQTPAGAMGAGVVVLLCAHSAS